MNIVELAFDIVYFNSNSEVAERQNHIYSFSPDLPYLYDLSDNTSPGPIYPIKHACIGGYIFIEEDDRPYYVNQCQVLKDFQFTR